ncbi:MAG: polysaccharide pyruvyl transferase CsaB, partial [Clostridia bacterium]
VNTYTRESLCRKFHIPFEENMILVGILARLYPVKSIDTLIEAARLVKTQNRNVKFLIGGEGEDYRKLAALVKKYRLQDTCYFLGWLKDPYELMSVIDISVLTSISEGLPYSLLEGALFRKATISTAVGGIPDLIKHNVNGYLLKPKDVQSLVGHILDLAGDQEKRKLFGSRLYEVALSGFSIEKMALTQKAIYHDVISWEGRGKRAYDIILSGYYGFGNIGDDALLYSILFNLKSIEKDIKILILSRNPVETSSLLGVDSISRVNLFEIISTMKRSSLFVYGGGTLIQESTSTRSLLYYLGTMYLAKLLGLRTMLYANGVEPLKKKFNRIVTKKVVNSIDLITLRELKSAEQLKALGITKPRIEIMADPAVTTYPCSPERVDEIFMREGIPPDRKYLGISVREWQGFEKRFVPIIARYADHMHEAFGFIPVFIPMQRRFVDDESLSRSLMTRMKSPSYILSEYYSAEETMGIIGRLDLLVGMRLHSLIFAACCQTPLIGLVYEPKVEWFMQYIGLPQLIAGHVSTFTYEMLLELSVYAMENRDDIRDKLGKETILLRKKAMHNAHLAIDLKNN